ncbi:hypothetical protein Y032_0928g3081, partial [Ancylostoma ceylanicum]
MLLWLVLLVAANHAMGERYQIPLSKIQSKMVQMLRAGSWATHVKEMRAKNHNIMDAPVKKSNSNQNINTYHDMEYIANITIGNPEQTFTVVLDTGSPDTWVVDYTCSADKPLVCDDSICDQGLICKVFCPHRVCCEKKSPRKRNPCRGKHYFESAKSSTYVSMNGTWTMGYRPWGKAKGFFGNDTLRFGDKGTKQLVVPATKIGFANGIDEYLGERRLDGVVGLAFSSLSYNDAVSPFERAWELGLVEPKFTVYMERVGWDAENVFGGMVTYGGLDTQHCGDVIAYEPVSVATYWKFKMDPQAMMTMSREMMREERKEMMEMFFKHLAVQGQGSATSEVASVPGVMSALSNRIEKFVFDPDMDMGFTKWYTRYKEVFIEDAKQLTESARVRLLCEKLDSETFERYQRHVLPKEVTSIGFEETVATLKQLFDVKTSEFTLRYQGLNLEKSDAEDYLVYTGRVNEFCERARIRELDSDGIKCLLWIFGLKSQREAEIRQRLIAVLDREYKAGRKLSLQELYRECENFLSLKKDSETIAGNVKTVEAAVKEDRRKRECWNCCGDHFAQQCKSKPWFCKQCKKTGHKERFCEVANRRKAAENGSEGRRSRQNSDNRRKKKIMQSSRKHVRGVKIANATAEVRLEKCSFAKPEIRYLGFIVDKNGRRPNPEKIEAIKSMVEPKNVGQLRAFLGMITYYAAFMPTMKDLRGPLDALLKKDVKWEWTSKQQLAFEKLKKALSSELNLAHYDPRQKIVVAADACDYGIGCVISHRYKDGSEKPIAHASRSLTAAEKNYSQIEKEALG